jgi:hypothetical protein
MPVMTEDEVQIRYEGPGTGTEFIAMTQANFLVLHRGHAAKELAVMFNDVAMAYLAEQLSSTNDMSFRNSAARVAGRIWIERHVPRMGRIEPVLIVSRATFDEDPGLLGAIKAAVEH